MEIRILSEARLQVICKIVKKFINFLRIILLSCLSLFTLNDFLNKIPKLKRKKREKREKKKKLKKLKNKSSLLKLRKKSKKKSFESNQRLLNNNYLLKVISSFLINFDTKKIIHLISIMSGSKWRVNRKKKEKNQN